MPALEPDMLGRLYREHAPVLRLYARQWPVCGEDLVHDAFVKLAKQTRAPERVLPWLYAVVRNLAFASHRAASRRRGREGEVSSQQAWFTAVDDQLDAQHATQVLSGLELELREVIVARIWGGLTFEEIAQLVGCSLPTAHRRYQTGLAELRTRLDSQCKNIPTRPTI
jgi:RNA polymerase sigma-70 factor (ECF subfamily)